MKLIITFSLSFLIGLLSYSQTTIFSTGFEGTSFDEGWDIGMTTDINDNPYDYPGGLEPWEKWGLGDAGDQGYVHTGNLAAYIGATMNLENKYDWLMTPHISVPTNAITGISYWMWYLSSTPSYWTWLYIMVYDVEADTWEQGELILYEESIFLHYQEAYNFDLSPWAGKEIRVAFVKRGTYQFALDDISCVSVANGNDLALTSIISPNNLEDCALTANEEVKITIKNNGSTSVSSFEVSYTVNNNEIVTETVNLDINAGESVEYVFEENLDLSDFGDYKIDVNVFIEDDQNISNNALTTDVTSKDATITVELLTDKFAHETKWIINDNDGNTIASYGNFQDLTLHIDDVCVMSTGCYEFIMYDVYGDGISETPPGYLKVYYNDELVGGFTEDEANFGSVFTIGGIGNGCSVNTENISSKEIKIYPNPVSNILYLDNIQDVQSISIFDMLGREYPQQFATILDRVSIDFSKFKNGLYIVKVYTKEKGNNSFLIEKK